MAQRPEGSTPGGQRPVRPGWRKPGTAAAPGPRRNYHWLRRGNQGPPGRWQRRLVRYGSTALAILLIVAFIKILFWMPVKTPLITVAVTDYSAPFPPNAWAREDVKRFGKVWESRSTSWWRGLFFGQRENNIAVTPVTANWQSPEHAITSLGEVLRSRQAQPAGPGKTGVVLIYLSAHGMLDSEGKPCLLLGGAPAEEVINAPFKDRVLKLSDVFAEIKKCFPPEANKVLFLDANRIDSCWPLGILYNGFAESLDQAVRGSQINNLYVLNSTSTGTVGRASPKLQASLFAHYLAEGLQRGSDQDGDGKISLHELWKYVEAKVSEQTLDDSPDRQLPTLLPTTLREQANNVLIAWHRKTPLETKTPPPAWDTAINRDALGELWKKHAQLRPWSTPSADATEAPTPVFRQPVSRRWLASWEAFQQGLIRYEQLLCAGEDYLKPAEDLKSQLDAMVDALETATPAEHCVAHSLPLAEMYCPPADPKGVAEAQAWLDNTPKPGADKSDSPQLATENAERAIAAWKWVLAEAKPKRIERAIELLDDGKDLEPRTYIETHFLRLLGPNLKLLPDTVARDTELLQHAFECRQAAEIAAVAAGDERIHYFVRNAVQAADAMRRQAEDKMFVGNPSDREKTLREFREAQRQFADASQRANALAKVFNTRDRGSAELPYLAAWLSRRPAAAVDETRKDRLQQLDDALARHRSLVDQLDTLARSNKGAEGESAPDPRLSKLADDCDADLKNLEGFYSDAVSEVIKNPGDRRNLRRIEELLRVPLVTGDLSAGADRGGLFNIMLELLNEEKPIAPGGVVKTTPAPAALERPLYLRWAGSEKQPHPTLQLLELSPKKEVSDDVPAEAAAPAAENSVVTPEVLIEAMGSLAKEGNAVQNELALASGKIAEVLQRISEATAPQPQAIRNARATGVRIARRVMPFLALPCRFENPEKEVFHETQKLLQQFDQQQLMAWHAERTLDDFWGPKESSPESEFFATISRAYLDAAAEPESESVADLAGLRKRLSDQIAAANEPLKLTVTSQSVDESNLFQTQFVVASSPAEPSGIAAVYVSSGDTRKATEVQVGSLDEQVERFAFKVTGRGELSAEKSESIEDSIQLPLDMTAETKLWLTGLYRAHKVEQELHPLKSKASREIVWTPAPPGKPSLTVNGEFADPGTIAFILDCSGSMKIEELNADARPQKRIEIAVNALTQILNRLKSSGKYKVSLWLYGHRCGDDQKGGLPWHGAFGKNPGNVLPSDDVDVVIPRRVLDDNSYLEFRSLLRNKVIAHGLTPLYLAMCRVLEEDLANAPANAPRRMIVITDGNDKVSPNANATWRPNKELMRSTVDVTEELRKANGGSPILLDIVGCGIDDSSDLQEIVKYSKEKFGSDTAEYHDVNNGIARLSGTLEKALGLYAITITPEDERQSRLVDRTMVVGETRQLPSGRAKYSAKVDGQSDADAARFSVEADESIAVSLQKQPNDRFPLVFRRNDFNNQADPFPPVHGIPDRPDADFDPKSYYLSALRAEIDKGNVPFKIAVQNGKPERFSPRPAEYWVKITPLIRRPALNDQPLEPYIFYDRDFEPKQSVPVISCLARNWPDGANAAEISVFFKMHATQNLDPLTISDIALGEKPFEKLTLRTKSGSEVVRFAVVVKQDSDFSYVIVKELHEQGSPNLELARVSISQSPHSTVRRYYSDENRIEHKFIYKNVDREQINKFQILITPYEDLIKNAVRVTEPLRVIVAN